LQGFSVLSFSFRIRPGTREDIPAISRTYASSWRSTYQDVASPAFVKGLTESAAAGIFQQSLQPNAFSYFLYVAEVEGQIVGFADGGKERSDPEKGIGELYAIYLLKEFQGKGIGQELFKASAGILCQAGLHSLVVWVLEKSPYRTFYEKLGGQLLPGVKTLDVAGEKINLVSYSWQIGK
jgi:GNAT superfamily N-acetyltransferase